VRTGSADPDETTDASHMVGMTGALKRSDLERTLGLKASLGLHKRERSELVPPEDEAMARIRLPESLAVTIVAVLDKLEGKSEFKGVPTTDVFCGQADTRV